MPGVNTLTDLKKNSLLHEYSPSISYVIKYNLTIIRAIDEHQDKIVPLQPEWILGVRDHGQ